MAGEVLFRIFNTARHEEAQAALSELKSARRLSASSLELVQRALHEAPTEGDSSSYLDRTALSRIVRAPELELRYFLTPTQFLVAAEAFVSLYCYENAGRYSLCESGPTWIVLEASIPALREQSWVEDLLIQSAEVPAEGVDERLRLEALARLRDEVAQVRAAPRLEVYADWRPELEALARPELDAFQSLIDKALSGDDLTLAYQTLL